MVIEDRHPLGCIAGIDDPVIDPAKHWVAFVGEDFLQLGDLCGPAGHPIGDNMDVCLALPDALDFRDPGQKREGGVPIEGRGKHRDNDIGCFGDQTFRQFPAQAAGSVDDDRIEVQILQFPDAVGFAPVQSGDFRKILRPAPEPGPGGFLRIGIRQCDLIPATCEIAGKVRCQRGLATSALGIDDK